MKKPTKHQEFAERLNKAFDYAGIAPGRGRSGGVADHFDVSRETARKWINGISLPEIERMLAFTVQQNVSFEWLATGRGTLDGKNLSVREQPNKYDDHEELRLIGLVRKLHRKKRRALIQLLQE